MIKIKNLKNERPNNPWDFKIDRSTPVGNPFVLTSGSTREDVCRLYEQYFKLLLSKSRVSSYLSKLVAAYKQHGKLNLFCWCAPKRCHGETIKKWILKQ